MREWMITYTYSALNDLVNMPARYVTHAYTIDEALESANVVIRRENGDNFTIISIERQG